MTWMDIYAVGVQTSARATAVAATHGIPVLTHSHLDPGQVLINQRKATGISTRYAGTGMEYQISGQNPTATLEFAVNKKNLSHFLGAFFQKTGFRGAASVYPKYFIPWEDPGQEAWLTLVRKLAASGTSDSHRIIGGIPSSITLSANENEDFKASVTIDGYSQERNRNIASDTTTFLGTAILLWKDATVTLDGNTVNISGFSLTLSNSLANRNYDSEYKLKAFLNDCIGTGTIQIPWGDTNEGGNAQIDDFVAGTTARLIIKWGSNDVASSDGDFSIIMNIKKMNATLNDNEGEIQTEVPFECVTDYKTSSVLTSTSPSTVAIAGSTAVTGTNTEFSNLSAGDYIVINNASAAGDRTPRVITTVTNDTSIAVYPAYSGTENTKYYEAYQTPITISIGDSQNITGM